MYLSVCFLCSRKLPVREINLERVLVELELDQEKACSLLWQRLPASAYKVCVFIDLFFFYFSQFIDLCILLGCDYCDSIKGLGTNVLISLCASLYAMYMYMYISM